MRVPVTGTGCTQQDVRQLLVWKFTVEFAIGF